MLCIGAVLLVGSAMLALAPYLLPRASETTDSARPSIEVIINNPHVTMPNTPANNFALAALGAVLGIAVLLIFFLIMRRYNDDIRRIVGKVAKTLHLSIQLTELVLSTAIWAIVTIVAVLNAPLFASGALIALIINNLFFIVAWTSYGCRNYTL